MSALRLIIGLSIGIAILGMECAKEKSVSGIEITNGNCVGTIYHADGSVADSAVVRLIPSDYNPLSISDSLIHSAVTDKNGRFSFKVTLLRRYNVIAQKASVSCMDSVELIPNVTTVVNDTLRQSGFISGAVRLQNPDTAISIVVLVMGTNVYTMPSDTSGKFTTPLLAASAYTLRIFSTQSGYRVFDTVVIVDKGAETKLPVIFLPSANAPSVDNFSVTFDSLTMYATLAWSLSNTDSIVSYSLHRTSKIGNDSLFVIDKSLTGIIEDLLLYEGDTLTYQIAANGKNFKEGFRSKPLTVATRQKVRWDKRIATKWDQPNMESDAGLFLDFKGNMFLVQENILQKLDTNGNFLNRYENDSDFFFQRPQADEFGNIYIKRTNLDGTHGSIIRFDADLNKRKEFILPDTDDSQTSVIIACAKDGRLFVIRDSTGGYLFVGDIRYGLSRRVTVYDSNFVKQNEYFFQNINPVFDVVQFGNTFVAGQCLFGDQGQPSIGWYDENFNEVSEIDKFDYVNNFIPRLDLSNYSIWSLGGPNGFIFTYGINIFDEKSFVLVSTADEKLVARFLTPNGHAANSDFDHEGNFYCGLEESVDGNNGDVFYRYPTAKIFGAIAPSGQ
jgi:hypothetical protein